MKKVIFGLLLLALILGGIFYKQILATVDFYQHQHENAATFAKATINWDQIPFSSNSSSGIATDILSFGSLQLPVPYGATKKVGKDSAIAVGYTELITITHSSAAASFFRMYNFSAPDKKAACGFLSQTAGRGACNSNYDFLRSFLELNKTDIHVFTSIEDKTLYNRLMTLRAEAVPSNTVSGFETSAIRGFLFKIDGNDYIAEVFDQEDQQYSLEFSGLEESDVAFVLSNISKTK